MSVVSEKDKIDWDCLIKCQEICYRNEDPATDFGETDECLANCECECGADCDYDDEPECYPEDEFYYLCEG